MSYFHDNKVYDKYIIDGDFNTDKSPYIREVIEIFNNEIFHIDLSKIVFTCSDETISNQ
jgi:hypothetical protein